MNNSISPVSNLNFTSRYLRIDSKVPQAISDALYKSEAVDEFLKAGKPKTIFGKIIDIFRSPDILDVYYAVKKTSETDIHAQKEMLHFAFGKDKIKQRSFNLSAEQKGIRRPFGNVPKLGEHHSYKAPKVTATEKLAQLAEKLQNIDIKLQ